MKMPLDLDDRTTEPQAIDSAPRISLPWGGDYRLRSPTKTRAKQGNFVAFLIGFVRVFERRRAF